MSGIENNTGRFNPSPEGVYLLANGMQVEIRPETEEDFPEIHAVNATAFGQDGEAELVELLRKSPSYIPVLSLVAGSEGKVVGHILFTKIGIRAANQEVHESLALAPMAVLPHLQKLGIGSRLILHGLDKARELGFGSVIVVGHENYYPKFGFLPADTWNIEAPFAVPRENFMAIELVPKGLEGITGTVEYPDEFASV